VALRGAAARRYAQAVFDIAKDTNSLDKWLNDLKTLSGIFGTPNAQAHLEDPRLTEDDQRKLVTQLLAKVQVDPLAVNLLLLLIRRNRVGLLPTVLERFQELYNKEKGIVVADVTTAVPLDEQHKQHVAAQLSRITGGKTIELRMHEDPRLLGGVVTRIGDQLIDASLATRLAELAERMV
jgi:F-type H+-transporting ATPase subunit delta